MFEVEGKKIEKKITYTESKGKKLVFFCRRKIRIRIQQKTKSHKDKRNKKSASQGKKSFEIVITVCLAACSERRRKVEVVILGQRILTRNKI